MFEDWIKEKQTATDHDIEKDFQIPKNTLATTPLRQLNFLNL